ncbi:hypothetical protein T08_15310 [Trichinella sp. T8]|nr:hypothetical protein T08_15310 [Trichinella sp. T8]
MELLYSHIVKILTEDQTIKDISRNISDKAQLKELEIKVILPTEFRDEGITQRFIKWLLGDRAVEGLKCSSATSFAFMCTMRLTYLAHFSVVFFFIIGCSLIANKDLKEMKSIAEVLKGKSNAQIIGMNTESAVCFKYAPVTLAEAMLLRHFVHAAVPPLHMVVGFTQPHHAHFKVKYWPPKAASAGSSRTRLELTSQHLRLPPFLACLLHNLI